MTKSNSQQRIRQVAIVLTCVDAQTKLRLLGQIPSDQARLVRQEIARLGQVDPREREEALKAFQSLTQSSPKQNTSARKPSPVGAAANSNGQWARSSSPYESSNEDLDSSNPAAELLDDDFDPVHDEIDIDYQSRAHSRENQSAFEPVNSNSVEPFVIQSGWEGFPASSGADIAKLLADERPTVVATVLKQVSTQLGAAILAALPSRLAASALSTIPNLDAIDQTIMRDIHETLREKLITYRGQLSPDAPDVQHIQSLLAIVPESKRRMVEQDLIVENSSLADSLGISLHAASMPVESRREATAQPSIQATIQKSASSVMAAGMSSQNHPEDTEIDIYDSTLLTFDDLEDLSPESLATVFRQSDPDTILIALTGAAIQLRTRLESMIAPNNLGRFRARIESLKNVGAGSRFAAREEITRKANELMRSGVVAAPTIAYRQLSA
jgi:flagellar motor switch protein FliG